MDDDSICNFCMCQCGTHSVVQRGDEEGLNFRLGKVLYAATARKEGQW